MSELRRRNKKKEKSPATKPTQQDEPADPPQKQQQEEETLWQTFSRHPLIRVLPIILIPYGFYQAYYFVCLRRPDLVSTVTLGMFQLRPAVEVRDERQLLIVGSMSSGTAQVAEDLWDTLGLEMGHENSNAQEYFVRDGTVSWLHVIRFMESPATSQDKIERWRKLCTNYTENMGFHPRMYKMSSCSVREKWSSCWARQCLLTLDAEWGCELGDSSCQTPFRTILHQVRDPLPTIESLTAKFCQGGLNGTIHQSFALLMSVLFPHHQNVEEMSCIKAAANYVIDYNSILVEARQKGLIDHLYRIEETSPCDVARMAGMMEKDKNVYAPNYDKILAKCDILGSPSRAQELMVSTRHKVNIDDMVMLNWSDLGSLERPVRDMAHTLGYTPSLESSDNGLF